MEHLTVEDSPQLAAGIVQFYKNAKKNSTMNGTGQVF
jgi:hypothetical protein